MFRVSEETTSMNLEVQRFLLELFSILVFNAKRLTLVKTSQAIRPARPKYHNVAEFTRLLFRIPDGTNYKKTLLYYFTLY